MVESVFNYLYEAMTGAVWISLLASLAWGVLSIILSPCHLSSIPLVVGFISAQGKISLSRNLSISVVFSGGILFTIVVIGIITASLGRLLGDIGIISYYLLPGIFILAGLYFLDIIKINWNASGLRRTRPKGLVGALILGLLFGIALGPCTFAFMAPVLGVVFDTAKTNYFLSITYLLAFALGHCSIIIGAGVLTGKVQQYLNWSESSTTIVWIKKICGVLLIFMAIYLLLQ